MSAPPWCHILVFLVCSLVLGAPVGVCAKPDTKPDLRFTFLSRDQGLHAGIVYCVMQDRQGYIWFGTRFGLRRYDGYEFKSYGGLPGDSEDVLNGPITSVCEDSSGLMWIVVKGGGLVSLDRRSNKVTEYRNDRTDRKSLSSGHIVALHIDARKRLWAVSHRWEMNLYDPAGERFTRYEPPTGFAPDRSGKGIQFLPTLNGSVLLTSSTFDLLFNFVERRFYKLNSIVSPEGRKLKVFGQVEDSVWYAVSLDGRYHWGRVFVLDPRKRALTRQIVIAESGGAIGSIRDRTGNLLLLMQGGLYRTDLPDSVGHKVAVSGLVQPSCIYRDRAERIWIGAAGGVYLCDQNKTRFQSHQLQARKTTHDDATAGASAVRALHAYGDQMRAGDQLGFVYDWNPVQRRFETVGRLQKSGLPAESFALHQIDHDQLTTWIYACNAGPLFQSQNSAGSPRPLPVMMTNGYAVCHSNDRSIWAGMSTFEDATRTGTKSLLRYDRSSGITHYYSLVLPSKVHRYADYVFSLYEDRHNQLWIGSSAGLFKYDSSKDTCIPVLHPRCDGSGYAPNNIWAIFEDSHDNLWLGSWGRGLHLFDRSTNTYIDLTTRDGLPDNNIQSILEDESGALWIATSRGLSRFDPSKKVFTNFGVADGLPDDEFQPKAATKLASGEMFFGAIGGITSFFPASIRSRDLHAPTVLTSMRVSGEELGQINTNDTLDLTYERNDLVFEYAMLDFSANERKRYDYMLVGLDEDWIHAESRHIASYNNIPPGDYLLRIRGTNANAPWSGKEMQLRISISPPFWESWWFRSVTGLTLAGVLGIVIVRGRRHQLDLHLRLERAREKERMDLAGDIHDGPLQDLYATRFLLGDESSELAQLLSGVRGDLRSISSVLQPPKLQFGLVEELEILIHAFRQRCPGTSFQTIALGDQRQLPEGVGRNIFRIVRTALTNVQKHSEATSCEVTVAFDNKGLEVSISDNGIGFDPNSLDSMGREHFGLFLMKCYAKEIQASINVEAATGKGTKVRLHWRGKRFTLSGMTSFRKRSYRDLRNQQQI